jgi:hypothetical protein
MEHISATIRRNREDQYFLEQEQKRLAEVRRTSAREAELVRLMEAFGIRERELVGELADAGFDIETFRLLYLVPVIHVAWSDGDVSRQESEQLQRIAGLHGIEPGSAAHKRLTGWLSERPSDQFFQASLRGVRAMLRRRPASEAQALGRDLVWYCTRIASASGGFFGLGSRISREEEEMLTRLTAELDARHHAAVDQVTRELSR